MSVRAVLFVDHATALGGAENSLLMLMRHLRRDRWRSNLVCAEGELARAARTDGIPTHIVELPRLRSASGIPFHFWSKAMAIAGVARKVEADVIYGNTVRGAFYAAFAARLARKPFIWHMRDFWLSETRPRWPRLDQLLKTRLIAESRITIVNSRAVADRLPPSSKIRVAPNGLQLSRFTLSPMQRESARADFRGRFGVRDEACLIGMVSRLRPWKGQRTFIRMAAKIADQRPETHFVIVGGTPFHADGGYQATLVGLAEECRIADQLHFTGHIDRVADALAAMDVFVHSGDPEPFGLVNIEAMAMEKPVVAFEHGALPEIVENDVTGLLVPPGQVDALVDAVLQLMDDTPRRAAMGSAARRRVESHFTIERTAARIGQMLEDV